MVIILSKVKYLTIYENVLKGKNLNGIFKTMFGCYLTLFNGLSKLITDKQQIQTWYD